LLRFPALSPLAGYPAPVLLGLERTRALARRPALCRSPADIHPPSLFIYPGSPVHAVGRVALTAHASAPESLADAGGPATLG